MEPWISDIVPKSNLSQSTSWLARSNLGNYIEGPGSLPVSPMPHDYVFLKLLVKISHLSESDLTIQSFVLSQLITIFSHWYKPYILNHPDLGFGIFK